jgi:hypothetical protein
VGDVLDALAAVAHTGEALDTLSWLASVHGGQHHQSSYRAPEIVACNNGLLHVGTRKLLELTPLFFNRVAVPFDYEAAAPGPTRWLAFLNQLWRDDQESIDALQEFFGSADHRGPNQNQASQTPNLSRRSALVRVPTHCSLTPTGIVTAAGKSASTTTALRSTPAFWPTMRRGQCDQH